MCDEKIRLRKSELKLRLWIGLGGLALTIFAIFYRGIPQGPVPFEVLGVAGLFFGGSAIWTARKLIRGEYSDGL
ncbi:MAG: hypothetical protein GDA40_05575 [Rhodobacteraceae bacterium]|nr:hypothetical protein [Paracoccaceae bacterium]